MKERKIMKKNNKGFSLVELIVVVLIMAIIATALTLAVTKYVAKSKRSSDANTAGELKTAAETAVTDYLTTVDSIVAPGGSAKTIKIESDDMKSDFNATFDGIFQQAAGTTPIKSKVHPSEYFVVTIDVQPGDIASYSVSYNLSTSENIFENGTK